MPMVIDESNVKATLTSQYRAGLAMLRDAIERCPDAEWSGTAHTNQFWQIAYHAAFFTHFYCAVDEATFVPWEQHHAKNQNPDGIPGPPDPASSLPLIPPMYTREQLLHYCTFIDAGIPGWLAAIDIASTNSGFPWYKISKLEHQLVNLRHLQHHTAQLADRLRSVADIGVKWVGAVRPKEQRNA